MDKVFDKEYSEIGIGCLQPSAVKRSVEDSTGQNVLNRERKYEEYQSGSPIGAHAPAAERCADRADDGAALRRDNRARYYRSGQYRPLDILRALLRQRRSAGERFYARARYAWPASTAA